jgi:hypothetical protein
MVICVLIWNSFSHSYSGNESVAYKCILLDLQIQFDGPECHVPNLSYYVAFATVFFLLALICLIQLVMCIVAEWQRMKAPSLLQACHVTTQKLLYFVVFLAAIIRGAYFTSPVRNNLNIS